MRSLADEVDLIMNPSLGGGLLWKFCAGFYDKSQSFPKIHHAFIVLPVLLNSDSYDLLQSTHAESGIRKFAEKLIKPPLTRSSSVVKIEELSLTKGAENLFALHDRVNRFRNLSFQSLLMAIDTSLISLNTLTAEIEPLDQVELRKNNYPQLLKHLDESYKFGRMCSAESLSSLSAILNIRF